MISLFHVKKLTFETCINAPGLEAGKLHLLKRQITFCDAQLAAILSHSSFASIEDLLRNPPSFKTEQARESDEELQSEAASSEEED